MDLFEDLIMSQPVTIIQSSNTNKVLNGPVQFGEDWPGTFMSIGYIKSIFPNDLPDVPVNSITDEIGFSNFYLVGFVNSLKAIVDSYPDDKLLEKSTDIQLLDEYLPRVESGPVCINGQYGYFMRGDNSAYLCYIISLKKELSAFEQSIKEVFSPCILK